MFFISRAGTPAATMLAEMFFATTDPAAITALRPITIPGLIIAPDPIHTPSSITIGSLI